MGRCFELDEQFAMLSAHSNCRKLWDGRLFVLKIIMWLKLAHLDFATIRNHASRTFLHLQPLALSTELLSTKPNPCFIFAERQQSFSLEFLLG